MDTYQGEAKILPAPTGASLLDSWLESLGARFPVPGAPPIELAGWRDEYQRLSRDWGVVPRPWISMLSMTGEDRVRFLNGLVTCDVKALEKGQATYGFATDLKGRILTDLVVVAFEDRLLLEVPTTIARTFEEHLLKYVIADRVAISHESHLTSVLFAGPELGESQCGIPLPEKTLSGLQGEVQGVAVQVVRGRDMGSIPQVSMWIPSTDAESLLEDLGLGSRVAGWRAWETLRVEAGIPLFGRDFDGSNFPQETVQDEAVSYEKGCYLGQEVVARIHYRGGVQRMVRAIVLEGGDWELAGADILADDRKVGRLTSLVYSPRCSAYLGLAVIHSRAEVGIRVKLAGSTGIVREVPLDFS